MNSNDSLEKLVRPAIHALPKPGQIPGPHATGGQASHLYLNSGEAWYAPSPAVVKAVELSLGKINYYPDNLCTELRQKIAAYAGNNLTAENIILGNGSDGLLDLLAKLAIEPGDSVIAPAPTFRVYAHAVRLMGGEMIEAGRADQKNGFCLQPQVVIRAATPKTKLIFLASPNNPTGEAITLPDIKTILENTSCLVVVDECYYEFCGESAIGLLASHPRLIILRSFSKSFALAGLRVGYALAHPAIIAALEKTDQTFTVNVCAQAAALAALEDLEYFRQRFLETRTHRAEMTKTLTELGLKVFPSKANILLVNYTGCFTTSLAKELSKNGVFVAEYHDRDGIKDSFRCAVTDKSGQQRLIARICDQLNKL